MIHNLQQGLLGLALLGAYGFLTRLGLHFLRQIISRSLSRTADSLGARLVRCLETPTFLAVMLIGLYVLLGQILPLTSYARHLETGSKLAFILILSFGLDRLLRTLISWQTQLIAKSKEAEWDNRLLPLAGRLSSIIVYALAGLAMLQQLDVRITPILASLGVASLAVALALQDTLTNLFAGLYVIADRPIATGDYIKLESGDEGYVERVGWRSTHLRTGNNALITVPNSKLAQSVLTNYSLPNPEMAVTVSCGVAYSSDLKKVEKVTCEVAREVQTSVPGGVKSFAPALRFSSFGESKIQFSIGLRASTPDDRGLLVHEFIKRLVDRYEHESIQMSIPVRIVVGQEKDPLARAPES